MCGRKFITRTATTLLERRDLLASGTTNVDNVKISLSNIWPHGSPASSFCYCCRLQLAIQLCVCGDTAPRASKRNQTPLNSDSRIKCSEINDPVIFHLSCDFTTSIWYTAGQLVATATAAAAVALSAVFSAFTPATHIHQELVRDPIVPIPAHSLRPFIVEKVWAPISYMCPSCSSWTHHMNHRICNAHMRFGVLHMPCMVFHILFLIYKYICCSLLSFVFLSLSVLEVHQCNPYKWFIIEIVMLVECAKQQREK